MGNVLESEDHKVGSQEPHKKVSQQRARSKKDQDLGMDNAKTSRACLRWTLASRSGDGVGYLNMQGPTTPKQKPKCEGCACPGPFLGPFFLESRACAQWERAMDCVSVMASVKCWIDIDFRTEVILSGTDVMEG